MAMQTFVHAVDRFLIWFYRLTGLPVVDFLLGTMALVILCLFLGKGTALFVLRFLQPRLEKYGAKAAKYQELAVAALKAGDQETYRSINRLANDAFGHTFFQQVALSAAYLWPVFFALAWMQLRFLDLEVPIPGTPWSFGFIGVFMLIYLATLMVLKLVGGRRRRACCSSSVAPSSPGPLPNPPLPSKTVVS